MTLYAVEVVRQVSQDFSAQFKRAWIVSSRWLPQGWLDALRQLALFAGAYYAYRIVRGLVDGQASLAFENARALVYAERALGTFFEPGLQTWAQSEEWIVTGANWMYVNSHFVVTTTFLIWLYIARNHAFYYVRNMFMIAMGIALVLYMAFPTAPPRFLPEWGFFDAVSDFTGIAQGSDTLSSEYAAAPSMHVGFALMIAIPLGKLVRPRALKIFWYSYPLVVVFVIVSTANHFILDAVLDARIAAIGLLAAKLMARMRPVVWSFRPPGRGDTPPGLDAPALDATPATS